MSSGLYTVAEIARYLGMRPQEVARMIKDDGLPSVKLPSAKREVVKITLHGLHDWMSGRHTGASFMTVDQLATEIAAANAGSAPLGIGFLQFHYVMEVLLDSLHKGGTEPAEAGTTILRGQNGLKPELRTKRRKAA